MAATLSLFLKKNKTVKENVKYAATKSLCDEKGNPLEWEIKPLTTRETDDIRDDCMTEVQVTGKPGQYRQKVNATKFGAKMLAASIVYPDLLNAELQDSYGVSRPEDLVREMVDNPGEYNAFLEFVQNFNGYSDDINEDIEEAKN
jgi:hypothetical protein